MITGFVQHEKAEKALQQFELMQQKGVLPNAITFVNVLKACATISNLEAGKLIHTQITNAQLKDNVHIGNALIDMYAKCGYLDQARLVFDNLSEQNVVSWTFMIGGYAQHGDGEEAIELFHRMHKEGMKPNDSTFVSTLRASSSIGAIEEGKQIHCQIINYELELDVCVGSSLVDMYAKCERIDEVVNVFEKLPKRDLICWNAIIAGHTQLGLGCQALLLFERMKQEHASLDAITYVSLLKACGIVKALEEGKAIHADIVKNELGSNLFIGSSLVGMYMKCQNLDEAQKVFENLDQKDVVLWNTLIAGYVQSGHCQEALKLFHKMLQEGLQPSDVTLFSALKACSIIRDISQGKLVHELILKNKSKSDEIGSSLVKMYAKCGSIDEAYKVFISLPTIVALYNEMIAAFAQHGLPQQSLEIFKNMRDDGLKPDNVTYANILKACGSMVAIDEAMLIHAEIVENDLEKDVFVANSLVDMYAKCGNLNKARQVFQKLVGRDTVSWNKIIAAYAQNGLGQEAIHLFHTMLHEGYKLNGVSFLCVLLACSHASLLDEGFRIFKSMDEEFDVSPRMEYYACMVDIMSRNGSVYEAEEFINKMSFQADASVLMSLLGACKAYGNIEVGQRIFESLMEMDVQNASACLNVKHICFDR